MEDLILDFPPTPEVPEVDRSKRCHHISAAGKPCRGKARWSRKQLGFPFGHPSGALSNTRPVLVCQKHKTPVIALGIVEWRRVG